MVADAAQTYVQARAASMSGDHERSALLLASLAQAQPSDIDIARKALGEAIDAGRMDLALSLAHGLVATKQPTDARLLLAADEIKRNHPENAEQWLSATADTGDLSFLNPLIKAWDAADRGNAERALAAIDEIPAGSLISPLAAEERGFILLKFRRTADAEPYARRAIAASGGREKRLRLAFADGFLAAGDRPRALMMLEGMGTGETAAEQRIKADKSSGMGIDNLPKAFGEVLTAFASDLLRLHRTAPPIGLVQVARYVNPQNTNATALLALLVANEGRTDEALALLRALPSNDPLNSETRDVETRILTNSKRLSEAYELAAKAAGGQGAEAADFSRLGNVLEAMKRHSEAADAYGRAVAIASAQNLKSELWSLLLLRAGALEEAKRWPEARAALQQGLALEPDQPLLLNFLGYAQLERNENLASAEAMIRKASELAPDDASITDSVGWAEFKRGKVNDAIATLQRAAEKDPSQAEIQEHLGDALFKSGRRFEARFAWNAALVTAEDEIEARVKAKLAGGLTTANAAP